MPTYRTKQTILYDGEVCRIKAVNLAPGGPLLTLSTKSGDVTVGAGEVTKAGRFPSTAPEILQFINTHTPHGVGIVASQLRGGGPFFEIRKRAGMDEGKARLVVYQLRRAVSQLPSFSRLSTDLQYHAPDWYAVISFEAPHDDDRGKRAKETPADQGWMIAKWGNKYLPRIENADLAQIKRNPREYIDLVNKIRDLSRYAGDATQKRQLVSASQLFAQAIRETLHPSRESNPVQDVPYIIQRAANTLRAGIAEV